MPISILRYRTSDQSEPHWGVVFGQRVAPLSGRYASTRDLLLAGQADIAAQCAIDATLSIDGLQALSPVTEQQQFLCQGINYRSHVQESGLDLKAIPFNTFFTKASSSLCGAHDPIKRPSHVALLDYEIELGLVIGRDLLHPAGVAPDRLHEFLAGVTIVNDLSARDVQLPQTQFYKGKSYRGFGPAGPYLVLLTPQEWKRWPELHMCLKVNGEIRQNAFCGEMIHQPAATVSEFSELQNLYAGDLIATGTPAGCAAKAPSRFVSWIAKHLLSEQKKWQTFIRNGMSNRLYLHHDDLLSLTIRTDDGQIDLGEQRNRILAD